LHCISVNSALVICLQYFLFWESTVVHSTAPGQVAGRLFAFRSAWNQQCRYQDSVSLQRILALFTLRYFALARKQIFALKLERASRVTAAQKLREKRACKYVQFWWRVVLECRREKQAALVIERFFASSTTSAFNQVSDHGESNADTMDYSERSQSRGIRHRASSPTMRLVMRHDQDREQAEENRTAHRRYERKFWTDKDGDTVMSSKSLPSNKSKLSVEDVALDQAMTAATTSMEEDTVISTEKYMKLYGLRSAPNKSARHFIFNNDTISTAGSTLSRTSTSSTWAATPSTSRSDTLRFSKLTHLQKTRKAMSPCQLESPGRRIWHDLIDQILRRPKQLTSFVKSRM